MKSKKSFKITTIVQVIYLLCMILNFLCIWMFTMGVPYAYPLAILGSLFILLFPIDLICLIFNLISTIRDIRASSERKQAIVRLILSGSFFVLLCAIKILLSLYGNVLVGVV